MHFIFQQALFIMFFLTNLHKSHNSRMYVQSIISPLHTHLPNSTNILKTAEITKFWFGRAGENQRYVQIHDRNKFTCS